MNDADTLREALSLDLIRNECQESVISELPVPDSDSQCIQCGQVARFMCSVCTFNPVKYCSTSCQSSHWPTHHPVCSPPKSTEKPDSKYYILQVYTLIKPVMLCIILSILWVKLANPMPQFYDVGPSLVSSKTSVQSSFGSAGSSTDTTSLYTALIILGQIVIATFLIACLFRYRKMGLIYVIFGVIVTVLLGYFGYMLGNMILSVLNAPLDYFTFFFILYNLVVVGVLVIFYHGPILLQQAYLILMSSMMAYSLTSLPALVTWILLGLLAVWDLIAVLCPFGPLRVILEQSHQQGTEIPAALIYSGTLLLMVAMVWMMASPPLDIDEPIEMTQLTSLESQDTTVQLESTSSSSPTTPSSKEKEGIKLGLGDFVFYSVLVGRASLYDWITTFSTMVAVTTGLTLTIFLLAVYKKPLPALPISITFGILFYLVSSITLTPLMHVLVQVDGSSAGFVCL